MEGGVKNMAALMTSLMDNPHGTDATFFYQANPTLEHRGPRCTLQPTDNDRGGT